MVAATIIIHAVVILVLLYLLFDFFSGINILLNLFILVVLAVVIERDIHTHHEHMIHYVWGLAGGALFLILSATNTFTGFFNSLTGMGLSWLTIAALGIFIAAQISHLIAYYGPIVKDNIKN